MLKLKSLRIEKGLKQTELAALLNVTQGALSGWETGRYDIGNSDLIKIADYFNVSTDYLLGRTDESAITSAAAPAQDALTTQEETHIKKYRQLDTDGKEEIDDLIDVKLAKLQRSAEKEEESLA